MRIQTGALAAMSVIMLSLGTGVHASAQSVPMTVTPVPVIDSAKVLLPSWAQTQTAVGKRVVWLQPVLEVSEPAWDDTALLNDATRDLAWFGRMSRGSLTVTATRVLPTVRYDSTQGGGGSCRAMAMAWAQTLMAFKSSAPSGTHLVGLTREKACPYRGLGDTPGNTLIITQSPLAADVRGSTLIHELGHNLGLPHASGYTGGLLSFDGSPSALGALDEYGDRTGVMGKGTDGNPMPFTAGELAALGWAEGVYQVPHTRAGSYSVALPPVVSPGPDAVVVDDPISGERYAFTHLSGPVTRSAFPVSGQGVFMHEIAYDSPAPFSYGSGSFAYWMPWDSLGLGIGAGASTAWLSPTRAVSVRVESVSATAAQIRVSVDPAGQLRDTFGPAWPTPPSVSVAGRNATVRVPAAWDQSGVSAYTLTVSGGSVTQWAQPRGFTQPGSGTFTITGRLATVTVVATDRLGNSTTWSQRVPR